jgi:hypothetical protein
VLKEGRGYSHVQYLQIKPMSLVIANTSYVTGTVGGGGRGGGRKGGGREGAGGVGREWEGELYISSVGSRAGGDNRKRGRSAQRRLGPKS